MCVRWLSYGRCCLRRRLIWRRGWRLWRRFPSRRTTSTGRGGTNPQSAELPRWAVQLNRLVSWRDSAELPIGLLDNRSSPGFVTGCWTLDRATSESVVLITFDSIEAAEALADNVRANAPHQMMVGIELMSIRIVEVSASA